MRNRKLGMILLGALLLCAVVFSAVEHAASRSDEAPYAVLSSDLEPFRSDFNARTDHVRAVLLVGPT